MLEVVINSRIRYRGMNGTASVVDEMERAFETDENVSVTVLQGPSPAGARGGLGRLQRLGQSVWWDGWAVGRVIKADVGIYPTGVGGWWSRAGMNILVVNDLMALDKGLGFDQGFRLLSTLTWPLSVRFADVILTPSEWTRTQLLTRWPQAEHKVVVVPYPCRLTTRTGQPKKSNPAERPTIVMVSATEPHKDHVRGISVVQMARTISGVDFALAIVGPRGRAEDDVAARTDLCDPTKSWISRYVDLNDDQLVQLLDDGFALLNTSKAEGFGLPLLEAAARDLPVVHSRAGSLNEVIEIEGDAPVTTLSLAYELTALLEPASFQTAVERGRAAVRAHSSERFAHDLLRLVAGKA